MAEIALFIENLNCSSFVASDQMSNLLFEVEGQLPEDKEKILKEIIKYQQKLPGVIFFQFLGFN